jgi:hypothetical protein
MKLYGIIIYVVVVQLVANVALAAGVTSVAVDGTVFKVTLNDGRVLRSPELVGAILNITTAQDKLRLRIDSVERDPNAVDGEVWLHTFSVQDADGTWQNRCDTGPDGRRQGFPLALHPRQPDGAMEPSSETFELTCTGGAWGKCVRFGYRPWESAGMLATYNSCVRMVRADYCGDGVSTTRDGMLVDVYDDRSIQKPDYKLALEFEAGWTAEGAVCVRHVRVKDNITLDNLVKSCPRLKDHTGDMCTEHEARSLGATLFNRSKL